VISKIRAWAAPAAKKPLAPFEYDPGPLDAEEVEVTVEHCGVCHSDLSVLNMASAGRPLAACIARPTRRLLTSKQAKQGIASCWMRISSENSLN